MAHRRKHRRRKHHHARENPLSDTTTIVIAVGVTAAIVGVGYFLYKRQQEGATAGAQQFGSPPLQLTQSTVRDQEATPNKPQGSSTQSSGDSSTTSYATLAPKTENADPAMLAMMAKAAEMVKQGCIPTATPPYYSCPPQKLATTEELAQRSSMYEGGFSQTGSFATF
jgi:hypothetical protein